VKTGHATFAWLRHDFPRSRFVQVAKGEDGAASLPAPAIAVDASPAPASTSSAAPSPSN